MAESPGLLALVIDDPLAPRILAWWKAARPLLANSERLQPKIARMTRADSLEDVSQTLERCTMAGLIVDGGISETAERWLNAHVGQRLGLHKIKPPKQAQPAKT